MDGGPVAGLGDPTMAAALRSRTRLPVIAAPMFLISGPDLVIAACRAGIIGAFPATNARELSDLDGWCERITLEVSRSDAPWAMNLILHSTYQRTAAELERVARFQPPIVITALGSPRNALPVVHGYSGLVFADVVDLLQARKAVDPAPNVPSLMSRVRSPYAPAWGGLQRLLG